MTSAPKPATETVALPGDAEGLAELVARADWVIVSEEAMTEAGVDPSIAHMFFANFASGPSIRLSQLAVHITRRHADWRPAAIRTAHHMLHRSALVTEPHDPRRCGYCQSFIARS